MKNKIDCLAFYNIMAMLNFCLLSHLSISEKFFNQNFKTKTKKRESESTSQNNISTLDKCSRHSLNVRFEIKYLLKVFDMNFPDKNCERELKVVYGEDDEFLLPFPGSVAHLPVDQTRLKIKDINLTEIWDLLGDFPVGDGQNAY